MLGLNRDLNPGPPAPEAGIIPLDHYATLDVFDQQQPHRKQNHDHGTSRESYPFCTGSN